jgi:hypothetical protein
MAQAVYSGPQEQGDTTNRNIFACPQADLMDVAEEDI